MYRSYARLDHALPFATVLLSLWLASVIASAAETSPPATPRPAATQGTSPPPAAEATEDDFFSWIKKLVEPTSTGKPPVRGGKGDRDGGGRGGGGGHN
jgi:hypothetical protein